MGGVVAIVRSQKFIRGNNLRRKTLGEAGEERRRLLEAFHPDLMRYPIEFAFGDVLSRPGLDHKTRELITLALAIGGGVEREVKSHTRGFLNHGGTKKELVELLIQIAVYSGFPRMIAGTYGIIEVFEERGLFKPPKPLPAPKLKPKSKSKAGRARNRGRT
jgi:4-carboxymuconolactone decarboxylase